MPTGLTFCGAKVYILGDYYFEKVDAGKIPGYEVIDIYR
jgi:hypothetical protein